MNLSRTISFAPAEKCQVNQAINSFLVLSPTFPINFNSEFFLSSPQHPGRTFSLSRNYPAQPRVKEQVFRLVFIFFVFFPPSVHPRTRANSFCSSAFPRGMLFRACSLDAVGIRRTAREKAFVKNTRISLSRNNLRQIAERKNFSFSKFSLSLGSF